MLPPPIVVVGYVLLGPVPQRRGQQIAYAWINPPAGGCQLGMTGAPRVVIVGSLLLCRYCLCGGSSGHPRYMFCGKVLAV